MASKSYKSASDLFSGIVIADLVLAMVDWQRNRVVTFRPPMSDYSPTEQRLPKLLVERARAELPWQDGDTSSVIVHIPAPAREDLDEAIAALSAEHSPRAIATALGVDKSTVYRKSANRAIARRAPTGDEGVLIAGLAAIRRRENVQQRWVADAMGISTATLSGIEHDEPVDSAKALLFLHAMAQATRIGQAHLRRQALEAGAALRALRELPAAKGKDAHASR